MKKKFLAAGILLTAVTAVSLCACNGAAGGSALSASDAYGVGAVSTVKLLGDFMPSQAVRTFSAVSVSMEAPLQEESDPVKAQAEKFNEYFTALDSFLGEELVTTVSENNTDEAYPYETKLTIRGKEMNGETAEYVMYYTETQVREETDDDGETETAYSLEGVMVQNGAQYYLEGMRTFERDGDETENELKIRAYADKQDKSNYVEMKQETSEETDEREAEYVYGVYVNGKLVEETAVEFETEREHGKEETEYTLEFRSGEGRGKYDVEREIKNGKTVIKVKYSIDGKRGYFKIRETVDANGEKHYEYTFADGSTKLMNKEGKNK